MVWRSTRWSPYEFLTTRRLIRWVSNLQLVALERLPSIERAAEILIDLTFLRGTKAPLKGELAARNALSEGFCGRASGAWSNNALPTSLLLRKTSQSASLTAPLSGEPLAFAALRVTTSSVALVDAVGRRPRWSCVTAAVRKRKRSGKRFAHQQTGYGCSHKSAWHLVQCAAAAPTPYAGVGS